MVFAKINGQTCSVENIQKGINNILVWVRPKTGSDSDCKKEKQL